MLPLCVCVLCIPHAFFPIMNTIWSQSEFQLFRIEMGWAVCIVHGAFLIHTRFRSRSFNLHIDLALLIAFILSESSGQSIIYLCNHAKWYFSTSSNKSTFMQCEWPFKICPRRALFLFHSYHLNLNVFIKFQIFVFYQ